MMGQSEEFREAQQEAIATGKAELSFGERLKQARRAALMAKPEQIPGPVKPSVKTNPMERPGYRGAYQIKRPAARIQIIDAIAAEEKQKRKETELQQLLADRRRLREQKQLEKEQAKKIAIDRLKEVKKEKREPKLPAYTVGQPDAFGKTPIKILDGHNTTIYAKPGADIEAMIRKYFFRPENEIKPLAYYSPNAD